MWIEFFKDGKVNLLWTKNVQKLFFISLSVEYFEYNIKCVWLWETIPNEKWQPPIVIIAVLVIYNRHVTRKFYLGMFTNNH